MLLESSMIYMKYNRGKICTPLLRVFLPHQKGDKVSIRLLVLNLRHTKVLGKKNIDTRFQKSVQNKLSLFVILSLM